MIKKGKKVLLAPKVEFGLEENIPLDAEVEDELPNSPPPPGALLLPLKRPPEVEDGVPPNNPPELEEDPPKSPPLLD